jgi:hypothetical protein
MSYVCVFLHTYVYNTCDSEGWKNCTMKSTVIYVYHHVSCDQIGEYEEGGNVACIGEKSKV